MRRGPQQPDQFDWLSAYLNDRGLQRQWRLTTSAFTATLAALPMILLASSTGPDGTLAVAVSVLAAAVGGLGALLWLVRWPSRRQSILFCLAGCASIAGTCLAQSDPYTGLMGCTTFAVIGGFISYFHHVGLTLLNLAVATVCSVVLTYRFLNTAEDVALAATALLIVASLNIGVPFGIYSMAHALRSDLRSAGHDPLTGLLNRRSFRHAAYELLMRNQTGHTHLAVTMIDLDQFKRINDDMGHTAGDQVLVRVAAALRDNCRNTSVIGRDGGEEFVVADTCGPGEHTAMAERMREAIAAIPTDVTASIGTAVAPLAAASARSVQDLIDRLIHTADAAMYEAKRAGGNQVRDGRPDWISPPADSRRPYLSEERRAE